MSVPAGDILSHSRFATILRTSPLAVARERRSHAVHLTNRLIPARKRQGRLLGAQVTASARSKGRDCGGPKPGIARLCAFGYSRQMSGVTTILKRHNAKLTGSGEKIMMFAHGFGCDQNMWRFVAPAFEEEFRVPSLTTSVRAARTCLLTIPSSHASLSGYADDVIELARAPASRQACSSAIRSAR